MPKLKSQIQRETKEENVKRFFRRWLADENEPSRDELGRMLRVSGSTARRRYDDPGELRLKELWELARYATDEELLSFIRTK